MVGTPPSPPPSPAAPLVVIESVEDLRAHLTAATKEAQASSRQVELNLELREGASLKLYPGAPNINGEDACEGKGLSHEKCNAVGCCQWNQVCWSAVGDDACSTGNAEGSDGKLTVGTHVKLILRSAGEGATLDAGRWSRVLLLESGSVAVLEKIHLIHGRVNTFGGGKGEGTSDERGPQGKGGCVHAMHGASLSMSGGSMRKCTALGPRGPNAGLGALTSHT